MVALALFAPGAPARAERLQELACDLLPQPAQETGTSKRRSELDASLRQLETGRHKEACASLEKLRSRLHGQVTRLLHPPAGSEPDHEAIAAFLEDRVYGPQALLRVVGDDFRLVPAYYLAAAGCACRLGELSRAQSAIRAAGEPTDPRFALAGAALKLVEGDGPAARALLGSESPRERLAVSLVRALALFVEGQRADSLTQAGRAVERCAAPAECRLAERVRAFVTQQ
jgi:hypothetical protein